MGTVTTLPLGVQYIRRIGQMFGSMFGGNRNLYEAFGYTALLTNRHYQMKYTRQDIAKRVIDAPVNALWSDPPQLEGDEAFLKAWQDLLAQIPVFATLQRLDKLAGLGRYAIMVIGFDDGGDLAQPVRSGVGRKVLYLQPYSEASAKIDTYETDHRNPRFGLPTQYTVDPGKFEPNEQTSAVNKLPVRTFKVHHSRVLHVAEGALESTVYGHSRLEVVYNVLDDIMKVAGGAAETYWMIANRGMQVDVDKDMELDPEDMEQLADEVKEYEHGLRRIMRTRGVKVNNLGSDTADPRGPFDVSLSLLASATGIPKRVLAGSEAGQLASQQDRANWALKILERITEYGEPIVMLPFLRTLIYAGVLPQPSELSIVWPDAFKMNPFERAQTSAQMARSAANLAKALETQENINQSMARAAQPSIVPDPAAGGGFGNKPFGANAADSPPTSSSPAKPAKASTEKPVKDPTPKVKEMPPLMPERDPIEFITVPEARRILGFGKHAPTFDEPSDTAAVKGGTEPKADDTGSVPVETK